MADPNEDAQGALTQAFGAMGEEGPDESASTENDSSIFGPGTSAPKLASTFGGKANQWGQYALEDRQAAQRARQQQAAAGENMIKAMQAATGKLQGLNFGPSPAESQLAIGAAMGANTRTGRFGETLANTTGAMAQQASEQRKAEIQKQMLLAQYGIQTAGAQMNAAGKNAAALTTQQRADAMGANAAGVQQGRLLNKFVMQNDDGSLSVAPGGEQTADFLNWSKQFGKAPLKVPLPDGTFRYYPPTTFGTGNPLKPGAPAVGGSAPPPAPPAAAAAAPTSPGAVPAAAASGQAGAAPAAAPAQPSGVYRSTYTPPDLPNLPGNAFTSPKFEPAFERATKEAFLPQNIPQSSVGQNGQGFGQTANSKAQLQVDAAIKKKALEDNAPIVNAANQNLVSAQEMLQGLDSNGGVLTGSWASDINNIKAKFMQLGLMSPEQAEKISNGQEFTKYARQLASSGLKTTFGGRITNMELDSALKANPNLDLTEMAIRDLLRMEVQKDAQVLHQDAFMKKYYATPNADPGQFTNWYRRFLDPFSNSVVKRASGNLDFGSAVIPNASGNLGIASHNAQGWPLVQNASGVAYVNPSNPKEYAEVQVH